MSSPRKVLVAAVLAAGLLLVAGRASAAPVIGLPDSTQVFKDSLVVVPLTLTAAASDSIYGLSVTLKYDSTQVRVMSVALDSARALGFRADSNNVAGALRLSMASTTPITRSGTLARLVFKGIGLSRATVSVRDSLINEGTPAFTVRNGLIKVVPTADPPVAVISVTGNRTGQAPFTVQFNGSTSFGPVTNWSWDFGDGGSSTLQSPSHVYAGAVSAKYTVKLTVVGPGGTNTKTEADYITVQRLPVANFAVTPDTGTAPLTVSFTNTSQYATGGYTWDFPNGTNSSATTPPPYTFTQSGTYTIKLTAYNATFDKSETTRRVVVSGRINASIAASKDTVLLGQAVTLTAQTVGTISTYAWTLGDNTTNATSSVTKTYTAAGTYNVGLRVTGPDGTASANKFIVVLAPVVAGFNASADSVVTGQAIAFTDTSKGLVTSWAWSFGDNGTSTDRNPSHSWATQGTFTVSLVVRGPAGQSQATKSIKITNRAPSISPALRDSTVDEDTELVLVLTANENDDRDAGANLTWRASVVSNAALIANFNAEGGASDRFVFRPVADSSGTAQVRFTLNDTQGGSVSQTVNLTWRPMQDAPVVTRPVPADSATGVAASGLTLSWLGRDPDSGDRVVYDVRLGLTATNLDSALATRQSATSVLVSSLPPERTYFWRVTAYDNNGNSTIGPVWRFTTQPDRTAPAFVSGPDVVAIGQRTATLQWTTNEASTTVASYRLVNSPASVRRDSSLALETVHSITLTSLAPDSTYLYEVTSVDASGNRSQAKTGQFKTLAVPDTTAPQIVEGPVVNGLTQKSAVVLWRTNEVATSLIEYSLQASLASPLSVSDNSLKFQHTIPLSDLRADTTYYFRVRSRDGAGNASVFKTGSFKTRAVPDTLAPKIVRGPTVAGITPSRGVVGWQTDEISNSIVEYGLTSGYGQFQRVEESVTLHQVALVELLPDTLYFIQVSSVDASLNQSLRKTGTFRTSARPDTIAPKITQGPASPTITQNAAIVTWTTNELSDTRIDYGLREDFSGAATLRVNDAVFAHSVNLVGLQSGSKYFYRVSSADNSGNVSKPKAAELRTLATADTTAPRFLSGPSAAAITDNSVWIRWTTDEDADGVVQFGAGVLDGSVSIQERARQRSVPLTNLAPLTTYRFTVTVSDVVGNRRTSQPLTFRTLSAPDTLAPRIFTGPGVSSLSDDQVTIEWTTDEVSDSRVVYGTSVALGKDTYSGGDVLRHVVEINDLLPSTTYHYQVQSTDLDDNGPVRSAVLTFTTLAAPDTKAPRIQTGPNVTSITEQSAAVRWTTDEASNSRIEYGLTRDLSDARLTEITEAVLAHSLTLTNLLPDTLYYVQVTSVDQVGNMSLPRRDSFRTAAGRDTVAPQILKGPAAVSVSDRTATIELTTNEDADAVVNYGIGNFELQVIEPDRARSQSIPLSHLEAGSLYQVQVVVSDINGNARTSRTLTFKTQAGADTVAPVISSGPIVATRGSDLAVIEWTTNEPSDAVVEYGLTAALGASVHLFEDATEHSVRLNDLQPNSIYHYRALSMDQLGNGPVISPTKTFRTLAATDTTAPKIVNTPVVSRRTESTAIIKWTMNERSDGYVEYWLPGRTPQVTGEENPALAHEVELTNLEPGATYEYRVFSADEVENGPTYSPSSTFTTKSAPDTKAPVITVRPSMVARSDVSVTVQWQTDEPSDSRVEYGSTLDYDFEIGDASNVTVHRLQIVSLRANRTYHLRVFSTDQYGNGPTYSADLEVQTAPAADRTPPKISGVTVRNITESSASVTWTTDEPANSIVDYGTTTNYGGRFEGLDLVREHSVLLTNLAATTVYHFSITSVDGANNSATTDPRGTQQHSKDHTFRTAAAGDRTPPVILEGPAVFATNNRAEMVWRTDEPARYDITFDTQADLNGPNKEHLEDNHFEVRQAVDLTNLDPSTSYYYRLRVYDRDGNVRVASTAPSAGAGKLAQPPGGAGRFTTNGLPDTQWPVFVSAPRVTAKTANTLTIEWETDERSDSFVGYGSGSTLTGLTGDPNSDTRHKVVLTDLTPGQTYQYEAQSTDPSGNGATRSARLTATTSTEFDLVPPRITTTPRVAWRTNNAATIEWTTDELATSVVEYVTGSTTSTRDDATLTKNHSLTLTNLTASTRYSFRAGSVDASSNGPTYSVSDTFSTDVVADLASPVISSGPTVLTLTDKAASLAWTTNEMADSFVEFGTDSTALGGLVGDPVFTVDHRTTLTNLTASTRYFARVGSVDRAKNPATVSRTFSFTTAATGDQVAPATPQGVSVSGGTQVARIAWMPNTEVDLAGYNVYRRDPGGSSFALVASSVQDPLYYDLGLVDGAQYTYQISAVDEAVVPNESGRSAPVTVTPSVGLVASAPTAQGNTFDGSTVTVRIGNAQPVGARPNLTYTFQVSTDTVFSDVVASAGLVQQGSGTGTVWSFTRSLDSNTTYWWRARANDGLFDGVWMAPTVLNLAVAGLTGDFNLDGVVNFDDFFMFADNFGRLSTDSSWDGVYDLSGNLAIDFDDFFLFADNFGRTLTGKIGAVAAIADPARQPVVSLAEITRSNAVLRVQLAPGVNAVGYGVILSHSADVSVANGTPRDLKVSADGAEVLSGVLSSTATSTSWAGYRTGHALPLTGGGAFDIALNLGDRAIGSDLVVSELWVVDGEGQVTRLTSGAKVSLVPRSYSLASPYPNPFNPSVQLEYSLPANGTVRVDVYDVLGQRVRTLVNGSQLAGFYRVAWDGADDTGRAIGSGVYLVRMEAPGFVQTRKMVMVK